MRIILTHEEAVKILRAKLREEALQFLKPIIGDAEITVSTPRKGVRR